LWNRSSVAFTVRFICVVASAKRMASRKAGMSGHLKTIMTNTGIAGAR